MRFRALAHHYFHKPNLHVRLSALAPENRHTRAHTDHDAPATSHIHGRFCVCIMLEKDSGRFAFAPRMSVTYTSSHLSSVFTQSATSVASNGQETEHG